MQRRSGVFGIVLLLVLFASGAVLSARLLLGGRVPLVTKKRVAVLPVIGVINSERQFVRDLQRFRDDPSIRAFVLEIRSPGGGVAASQAMHGELLRLGYQAYRPLAERVLRKLAQAAVAEYGCRFVRIHHAICEVPVGEASVLIQVECPRRGEAFAACRFLLDELKARGPIWKRQQWARGATWAEGNVVPMPEGRP